MTTMMIRQRLLCTLFLLQCLLAFPSFVLAQDEKELSSSSSGSSSLTTRNNNNNNLRHPPHYHLQESQEEEERPRRQLWDFWSLMMLIHPPCAPPDAPHRPPHCRNTDGTNGSGSSSSYSGSSSTYAASSANAAYSNNGSSSSSVAAANSAQVSQAASADGFGGLGWYVIPVFFSICTTAYAVVVGSRRKPPAHNLTGALSRRVVATGAFADHTLPPPAGGPDIRLM